MYFYYVQKPGGLIFPDRATLYVAAIEDRQYKDDKINCKYLTLIKVVKYWRTIESSQTLF